jgi:hypothetical protein
MQRHWKKRLKAISSAYLRTAMLLMGVLSVDAWAAPSLQPRSLDVVGVFALRELDPELTGANVNYAVVAQCVTDDYQSETIDYQPNRGHAAFARADLAMMDDQRLPTDISYHATVVCSLLYGDDVDASNVDFGRFHFQGVVPQARGEVYEFMHFMGTRLRHDDPLDVDVLTMSCGWPYEDKYSRGIESLVEHQGLIAVASIGNGTEVGHSLLFPGAASNAIGVGVVDSVNAAELAVSTAHFSLAYPEHSSCGPTVDLRGKPDLVAPGKCLAASAADANSYGMTEGGSSYATPIVAGVAGLLVQKAKLNPEFQAVLDPQGGNCVVKALLMNSATKLPFWHKGQLGSGDDHEVPLDYMQGAGMVNALEAYQQLVAGYQVPGPVQPAGWDLNELNDANEAARIYELQVTQPGEEMISATVVWNRHYEKTWPFNPIENRKTDIRLELWAVDPDHSERDHLLDYSDSAVDNVEHIYTRSIAGFSVYQLIIILNQPDQSIKQSERYAIAWNAAPENVRQNILWHDLNTDGIVDSHDLEVLGDALEQFSQPSINPYHIGDVNTDGTLDMLDFEMLSDHVGDKAPWYVPEDR